MRKQVTFASDQTSGRLRDDQPLPSTQLNESKTAFKHAAPAAGPEAQTTAGPFLKHAALTPAQKEYLYTIAASYSPAHVRTLIFQHYVNVLHSCMHTGLRLPITVEHNYCGIITDRDTFVASKSQSEASSKGKQRGKTKSTARHSHKRNPTTSSNSTSKQRKMKKHTTVSPKTKRTPRRARSRRVTAEQQEEGLDDSLSECLRSLSVGATED